MIVRSRDAATLHTGRITLENLTGDTWISSHTLTGLPSGDPFVGGGAITLAAALYRVRITTTTGTDKRSRRTRPTPGASLRSEAAAQ